MNIELIESSISTVCDVFDFENNKTKSYFALDTITYETFLRDFNKEEKKAIELERIFYV